MSKVATDKEVADVVLSWHCQSCNNRNPEWLHTSDGKTYCGTCSAGGIRIRPEPVKIEKIEAIEEFTECHYAFCENEVSAIINTSGHLTSGYFYCAKHAPSGAHFFRQP